MKKIINVNRLVIQLPIYLQLHIFMQPTISLKLICFFTIILLISTLPNYNGSFTTSGLNTHGPYSFAGAAGNNVAEVILNYDSANDVTQMLMQVKTSNSPPTAVQRVIDYYDHKDPSIYNTYDLHDANIGNRQIVNIGGLSSGNQLYIFVINFNSQISSSYTITITQRTGINNLCSNGSSPSNTSIYCTSCSSSMLAGPFCNKNSPIMSNNVSYSFTIQGYGNSNGYFQTVTIPASNNEFLLYFTASNINIINAIQFKYFQSEIAGIMNAATSGIKTLSQYNTQYSISISTGGTNDVSVSFLNLNNNSVVVNTWFAVKSTSSILIIVLSVLGGILFIGLVVVAVCIIRRMRNSDHAQVSPLSAMMARANSLRINNQNDLNTQQIETYFPSVLCRNVLNDEQPSSNNLTNGGQKDGAGDRDCVICLCSVMSTDMIKITYCRHIFHATCLNKWFEKQRNCPYCREEYNKKSTIEHYQTLLGICHKSILAGIDLVKEIMLSKMAKSNFVIEQIKE